MDNNTANDPLPSRKKLDHRGSLSVVVSDAIYFITIAAANRGGTEMTDQAEAILKSARHYQQTCKWFLYSANHARSHSYARPCADVDATAKGHSKLEA